MTFLAGHYWDFNLTPYLHAVSRKAPIKKCEPTSAEHNYLRWPVFVPIAPLPSINMTQKYQTEMNLTKGFDSCNNDLIFSKFKFDLYFVLYNCNL